MPRQPPCRLQAIFRGRAASERVSSSPPRLGNRQTFTLATQSTVTVVVRENLFTLRNSDKSDGNDGAPFKPGVGLSRAPSAGADRRLKTTSINPTPLKSTTGLKGAPSAGTLLSLRWMLSVASNHRDKIESDAHHCSIAYQDQSGPGHWSRCRPDGFHQLTTVYQTLALHEWVTVEAQTGRPQPTSDAHQHSSPRCLPTAGNTAWRMVERYLKALDLHAAEVQHTHRQTIAAAGRFGRRLSQRDCRADRTGAGSSSRCLPPAGPACAWRQKLAPMCLYFCLGGAVIGVGRVEKRSIHLPDYSGPSLCVLALAGHWRLDSPGLPRLGHLASVDQGISVRYNHRVESVDRCSV